jgi:PAS domain S-box-containing protein
MMPRREEEHPPRPLPGQPGAAVLESIADGFFTLDREWRFTYVNRPAEFLLERDRDELLGGVIWEVFPDAVPPARRTELERVADGREVAEFREFHPSLGRWLEYRAYPWEEGLAVYFRDVTEAHHRETTERFLGEVGEVLTSSLEYAATVQRIADLCAGFLADYCVVHVEEGGKLRAPGIAHADPRRAEILRGLLRRFPTAPEGHPIVRVLRTGEPEMVPQVTAEYLEHISGSPEQLEMLRDLGLASVMVVPLQARGRTLGTLTLARSGSAVAYGAEELAVARELARRAALAVDNARLYEETRQAIRARDEILAVVSHDLRSPLHAVLIASTLLEEFPESAAWSDRDRKQVEIIRRAADQMTRLIQDLVEVISLESGPPPLQRAPLDAAGVVNGVVDMLRPIAEERRVRLEAEVAPGLPALQADRGRLLQVFSNLVGNAVRFTPEGGTVRLAAERSDGHVRFSVADTGPGIPPEHLPRLFDRFWQAQRGAGKGLGLGLAIAKGIVEAHGGRIWVESRPGEGATFRFTLPAGG